MTGAERRAARQDLVTGLVLLALTGLLGRELVVTPGLVGGAYGADPGPGLLPALLLVLLGLSAAWLTGAAALRLRAAAPAGPRGAAAWRSSMLPALFVATLIGYALLMVPLGYLMATIAFAAFWAVVIGVQDAGRPTAKRLLLYLLEAAAMVGVIYAVFAEVIRVPLP